MTFADYDMRVLLAVRRAVNGVRANDWGSTRWDFSPRVLIHAQRAVSEMTFEESQALNLASQKHRQTIYKVLDVLEEMTEERDIPTAQVIVGLYFMRQQLDLVQSSKKLLQEAS